LLQGLFFVLKNYLVFTCNNIWIKFNIFHYWFFVDVSNVIIILCRLRKKLNIKTIYDIKLKYSKKLIVNYLKLYIRKKYKTILNFISKYYCYYYFWNFILKRIVCIFWFYGRPLPRLGWKLIRMARWLRDRQLVGGCSVTLSVPFVVVFYCNIGLQSVYYAEVMGIILVLEYAAQKGWRNVWLEREWLHRCSLDFFHTPRWFLFCYETDGIMLVGWEFRLFLHIFTEKETVVQINWPFWATQSLERFGWIDFLLFWVLISFGIDVDFLTTDLICRWSLLFCCFLFCFFSVFFEDLGLVPPPAVIIFHFFNKIFLSVAV